MKKYALFLFLFLIMPTAASAVSIYDIGSGAQNLFSKFSERAAGTETVPNSPIICGIPPARPLYLGLRGEDVRRLQEFLYEGGYLNVQATGYFGFATKKALAEYQGEVGIARAGAEYLYEGQCR